MAWNRVLDIYVGSMVDKPSDTNGGATTVKVAGINPDTGEQGLDCEADITRSNRIAKNTATIKVYNANAQLRYSMEKPGQVVRVDAGYADSGYGTVFYGQVDSAHSTLEGADWVTEISASHFRAKNIGYETLFISASYAPGANLRQVIDDLSSMLGIIAIGTSNADITLDSGWTYAGPMKGALTHVRNFLRYYGRDLFYDLAELVIYAVGTETSVFEEVYLDIDSGLLKAQPIEDAVRESRLETRSENSIAKRRARMDKTKSANGRTRLSQSIVAEQEKLVEERRVRARFSSIMNHRLRPNCAVTLKSAPVSGRFILDDIRMKLDNFGTNFDCEGLVSREP